MDPFLIAATQHILAQAPDGTGQVWSLTGEAAPVRGLQATDVPIWWAPDERSVVTAPRSEVPALVERVDLVTGVRTRIGEYSPPDRAGLLSVRPRLWRDNGRQYTYDYYRRVSTMFLVTQ